MKNFNHVELLDYIDCARLSYQDWINVGMALKEEGYTCDVWDSWSRTDPERYKPGECEKKWQTFQGGMRNVTGAVITTLAKANGWIPMSKMNNEPLEWDSVINEELTIVDQHYIEKEEIKEPKNWNPADEAIRYLKALFKPDEHVGFTMQSGYDEENDKYYPSGSGSYAKTAQQLINDLKKYKKEVVIEESFGTYDKNAGAWVRFNPLDGKGIKDKNVTDFRYALIESDKIEIGKQLNIIKKLELPVAILVHSGNKSLHAIVHVDADTFDEYRRRVDFLYTVCQKNGLEVDTNDRNPSRLSRLPGCERNGKKQFVVAENIGKKNFAEWKEWIESINDDLPETENLADVWNNMPELSPPLIDGILRQGHKMLVAGPSKAGKSFALIELSIAIAEGTTWLGWQCTQGNVLYVNLELDKASCLHRFNDVYNGLNIKPDNLKRIDIWHLRGKALPMDKLAPKLIRRANKKDYIAVILDPIYKVLTGDENSAEQMAYFCNQFDKVATELKSAVIYCHHHSKGAQGGKNAMDRASGSGVFARDPDAILDMIQIRKPKKKEDGNEDNDIKTAWRISGTLREFPPFLPINVWFDWPIHRLDEIGELETAVADGSQEDKSQKGNEKKQDEVDMELAEMEIYIADKLSKGEKVTKQDVMKEFGISQPTYSRRIKKLKNYKSVNGEIIYYPTE